jgi:hypothetical protein
MGIHSLGSRLVLQIERARNLFDTGVSRMPMGFSNNKRSDRIIEKKRALS